MKKILVMVLAGLLVAGNARAISFTDGCRSSGLIANNAHAHITTNPSRIYGIIVTPTSSGGFAQLIETKNPLADSSGTGYVSTGKVLADIRGVSANQSLVVSLPGINAERIFVDTQNATCEFYYRE